MNATIYKDPDRCQAVIRAVPKYKHAACAHWHRKCLYRILTNNDPYRPGKTYLGRWCKTRERAWEAALRVVMAEVMAGTV